MPKLFPLGLQILRVVRIRRDADRNLLDDFQAVSLSPTIFFGLLVSNRIVFKPNSARICAPKPYSRKSIG